MKNRSKWAKFKVILVVSELAFVIVVFGSSAFGGNNANPASTLTPPSTNISGDQHFSDQSDAQAIFDGNSSTISISFDLPTEIVSVDPAETDIEVAALRADNQGEADLFNHDITDAMQVGNKDDATQLGVAASVVISVSASDIAALTQDNAQAHAMFT